MKKFLIPLLLASSPALSAPFTYGPESCEFQITFPEKPFIETKCSADGKDCAEIVTYTKAIGSSASTNFRISCNPATKGELEKYTPEILEKTLKQMSKSAGLEPYDTRSSDDNGYKKASSLSLSERDGKAIIYNGQIWVGKTSIFTLEAEMLGEKNDEIQQIFADILRDTYPKDSPPKPKAKTEVKAEVKTDAKKKE